MRFITVYAPTLSDLAAILNEMQLVTGRVVGYSKSGRNYEALVDMYPTYVVSNDMYVELDDRITLSA